MLQLNDLSFVRMNKKTGLANMWCPPAAGYEWAEGTNIGRRYADELIQFMNESGNFSILRSVVNAMACEPAGAIETGFFHRIAECAAASSAHSRHRIRHASAHPAK